MLQYFVRNSAFLESDPFAIAISSSMKSTDTETPRFGFDLRSSFMSSHLSRSSIMYKKGNSRFSSLSPFRNLVDLFRSSSNIESFIYPAVEQDRRRLSVLAPVPDFITSYCFRPESPSQAATSSHTVIDGLNPSDFLAEKAIFFTVEFVAVM